MLQHFEFFKHSLIVSIIVFFAVPFVEGAEDNWVEEEVLQQLQEVRHELSDLRREVAGLNTLLASLSPSGTLVNRADIGEVSIQDQPIFGDSEATLAIVEFTDFQCPFCFRHSQSVYSEIKEHLINTGKVKYVIRDFPLSIHPQAKSAAIAANCAGKQGGYWQAHDELFANVSSFGEAFYMAMAEKLGLDAQEFRRCLDDPSQSQEVEADLSYGMAVGVRGTPSFFVGRVNGDEIVDVIQLQGAQPYSAFASAVERLSQ